MSVAGDADVDGCGARVVGLVVVGARSGGYGVHPRRLRASCSRSGAGGDEVEYFDDLVAQAACEAGSAAEGVLAGDAALFVGGGAQRQLGQPEQAVVGVHAVAGGEDVGQVGAHGFVDDDGALDAQVCAGVSRQFGVGPNPDNDEDEIHRTRDGFVVMGRGDGERAGVGAGNAGDGGVGEDFDAVAVQFGRG